MVYSTSNAASYFLTSSSSSLNFFSLILICSLRLSVNSYKLSCLIFSAVRALVWIKSCEIKSSYSACLSMISGFLSLWICCCLFLSSSSSFRLTVNFYCSLLVSKFFFSSSSPSIFSFKSLSYSSIPSSLTTLSLSKTLQFISSFVEAVIYARLAAVKSS